MKKLATLLLAAGMVVAASAPANAVDVKVDYRHRLSFDVQSSDFEGSNSKDFKQRMRLGLTMAASENLSGYIQFQSGKDAFGSVNKNYGNNASDFTIRQMFVDWKVPATPVKVRMGRQLVGFPGEALSGHNSVMDAGWGSRDGVVVSAPVADWLGLSALWVRAGHNGNNSVDENKTDDVFGVIADMKFNGFNAAVYAAYANVDFTQAEGSKGIGLVTADKKNVFSQFYNTEPEGDGYWFGGTFTLTAFDPFTFALSAAYGHIEADGSAEPKKAGLKGEQEGWNVQAKASYKLDFGTPVLGAWYSSGADNEDCQKGEFGIMPSFQGYIAPTRSFHDAATSLNGGQALSLPAGNWGVQVGIEGMSFLKDLTSTFLVTYMQGTNKADFAAWCDKYTENSYQYLSEDDSLVSFDLVNTYKIYKNLAAHLELAYIINDFEESRGMDEDAWRAGLTFDFKF